MVCPRYRRQLVLLLMGRRSRKLWTVLACLTLLTWIYNSRIRIEEESYLKQMHLLLATKNASNVAVPAAPLIIDPNNDPHHSSLLADDKLRGHRKVASGVIRNVFRSGESLKDLKDVPTTHSATEHVRHIMPRQSEIVRQLPDEDARRNPFVHAENGKTSEQMQAAISSGNSHTPPLQRLRKPVMNRATPKPTNLPYKHLGKRVEKASVRFIAERKNSVERENVRVHLDSSTFDNDETHPTVEPSGAVVLSNSQQFISTLTSVKANAESPDLDWSEKNGVLSQSSKNTVQETTKVKSAVLLRTLTPQSVMTLSRNEVKLDIDTRAQTKEKFNLTAWESVQAERKRRVLQHCDDHGNVLPRIYATQNIVDSKKHILYCPVEKSASTFLRRFMYSLKHRNFSSKTIVSPFDIPIETALSYDFDDLRSLFRRGTDFLLADPIRFTVVREPFSRIYSAYVDKLLVPNYYYWKRWGIPIIAKFRENPPPLSVACGHDVTFSEFVKYVIYILHKVDAHVQPVDKLCAPCEMKYSVIGHMETLQSDFQYLLTLLKIEIANFSMDSFMNDYISDAVRDSTYSAFKFHQMLTQCVSLYETCRRLWMKMQLRGIISNDMDFPLKPEEAEKLTAVQFVQILEEARKSMRDYKKLRQQKYAALRDAYTQLAHKDTVTLVNLYASDFDLFGYDKYPSFLSQFIH